MKNLKPLTNEKLKYKFSSFFDLANYAINVAKDEIAHQESPTLSHIMLLLNELPDQIAVR